MNKEDSILVSQIAEELATLGDVTFKMLYNFGRGVATDREQAIIRMAISVCRPGVPARDISGDAVQRPERENYHPKCHPIRALPPQGSARVGR